ncbi:hypothetical protein GGR54DRAFT_647913 [Hypoxylon sp. NC1633]|nr:hypothetical protein GGR54DRAFT_647913 [Hypoxylon sp. NC1633]
MFEELITTYKRLEKARRPPSEILDSLVQLVPKGITSQDVRRFLEDGDESNSIAAVWVVYAAILAISQDTRDSTENGADDTTTLTEIADRISAIILPLCTGALDDDTTYYAALQRKGDVGLQALKQLTKLPPKEPLQLPTSVLLRVTAFTDPADPWTTAASSALAKTLLSPLETQQQRAQLTRLIVDEILTAFLRPLFSKSRPATVTASGRKAEFVETSRYDTVDHETPETKPWKYAHRYATTVFAWAVQHADPPLLQTHWPLFTPALLTLLDEPQSSAVLKARSLTVFRAFWARCPAGLMRDTGLAPVFEQAVFPAVLSLPGLTPEDESLLILRAAYPALVEMAGLEYTYLPDGGSDAREGLGTGDGEGGDGDGDGGRDRSTAQKQLRQITEAQRTLLDKIIREGVMVGYHHAKEHVRLVGLFCETLVCIVNGMGILAVKHLKDLIPMVSEIMADPFGTKHPPTLHSALNLLQAILSACWPRIPHHCDEIIKALTLCWLNIDDEESFQAGDPNATALKARLAETADMLSAVMRAADIDLHDRVEMLVEREPQLSKLFRACTPRPESK